MSVMKQAQQYVKFEYKEFGYSFDKNFAAPISAAIVTDNIQHETDVAMNEISADHFAEHAPKIADISEFTDKIEAPTPIAPVIDLEALKMEHYKRGYDEAKIALEPRLKRAAEDDTFHLQLKSKLEAIAPVLDIQEQIFKFASNILAIIAKKLHLMVPADFESIILGEMVPLLSKYYKIGTITLKVNPDRVDYCKNLFKIGSLPQNISENIVVHTDETMARDSCSMECNNTHMEYNQEELMLDIEKILEHLNIEVNH